MTFSGTARSAERDDRLNGLLAAYLEAIAAGEQPLQSDWLEQHPDFAVELREFFECWEAVSELARPLRETQAMLRALTHDPQQLSTGLRPVETSARQPPLPSPLPQDYELLEEIGRGGMGVVYKARHRKLSRFVALKMIRDGRLASDSEVRRFQNEAEAVAVLDHPHIVPIYEVGEHEGRAWFTMKLIEGGSLADALEQFPKDPRRAAELMVKVARAVDHAHLRGILHRDLKPSNVLFDGDAQPHVTDFGLARQLASESTLTGTGEMVGTPSYMSPEQASGRRQAITVATDVYGLGAVLYTLLTGRPPFRTDSIVETLRQVCEQNPPVPHSLNARVPRDLETICLKALDKSPAHRYPTAAALADDLQRFLEGKSIHARIAPRRERLLRWVRRNPAWAALIAVVATGAALSIAALSVHTNELSGLNNQLNQSLADAIGAREAAEASEGRTQELLYVADIKLGLQAWKADDPRRARELLDRHRPRQNQRDLRGFEWYYLESQVTAGGESIGEDDADIYCVRYSPDAARLAFSGKSGIVHLLDLATHKEIARFDSGQREVNGIAFSPDERDLATAGDDGTIRLWDLKTQELKRTIPAFAEQAYQVEFTPDGSLLASCGADPVIRLWDPRTGEPRGTLEGARRAVEAIAISPDGWTLGAASSDETARLWDLSSQKELRVLKGHKGRLSSVIFSADGRWVITGALDNTVRVWAVDSKTDNAQHVLSDHLDAVQSLAVSRDGKWLASGDREGIVRIRPFPGRAAAPSPVGVDGELAWRAHTGRVWSLAFEPHGQGIISAGQDGAVKLYRYSRHAKWDLLSAPLELSAKCDVALDGNDRLVTLHDTVIGLWELDGGEGKYRRLNETVGFPSAIVVGNGKVFATAIGTGELSVVGLRSGHRQLRWSTRSGRMCDYDPRHNRIAVASEPIELFDAASGRLLRSFETQSCHSLAFSADGRLLAASSLNEVRVYNVADGTILRHFAGHTSTPRGMAFTPDGRLLASVGADRQLILWDLSTGRARSSTVAHAAPVGSVAISPDGRTTATGGDDGAIRLWHTATGQDLLEAYHCDSGILRVVFSPDGRTLACARQDGTTAFCRLPSPAP